MKIVAKSSDVAIPFSFIDLYKRVQGSWFVPSVFHTWAALALIAASLEDRVSFELIHGSPLYPNIYVYLIGPAACGKNTAIDPAATLAHETGAINVYSGSLTKASLEDYMARRPVGKETTKSPSKVFLVTPELAMSVGAPSMAEPLIRFMVDIYTGKTVPHRADTRTHGAKTLIKPTVTWLAGTTMEWLRRALPPYIVGAGFLSRIIPVIVEEIEPKRQAFPSYPTEVDILQERLRHDLLDISALSGQMTMTPQAKKYYETWVATRPDAGDPRLSEWWSREDTLALKLSMLLSVSDSNDLVISVRHFIAAQRLVLALRRDVLTMASELSATAEIIDIKIVATAVRDSRRIPLTTLQRYCYARGIDGKRLNESLASLVQSGEVRVVIDTVKGRRWVVWTASTVEAQMLGGGAAQVAGTHDGEDHTNDD